MTATTIPGESIPSVDFVNTTETRNRQCAWLGVVVALAWLISPALWIDSAMAQPVNAVLYSYQGDAAAAEADQSRRRGVYPIAINRRLASLGVGARLEIPLYAPGSGTSLTAVIDARRLSHSSSDDPALRRLVLSGYIVGDQSAGSGITLVVGRESIYANITTGNGNLLVEPDDRGQHWLIDEREAGFVYRGMGDDALQQDQQDQQDQQVHRQAASRAAAERDPQAQPSGHHVINLLVLYSRGFAARNRDPIGRIEQMIAITNQGLANSGVNARIEAVHYREVDHADTESSKYSLDLMRAAEGVFASVADLRARYRADLVTLVRADYTLADTCGLAYLPNSVQPNSLSYSYGFSSIYARNPGVDGCPDWVLAHELGHNFGADHDRDTGCNGLLHYACGYRDIPFFKTLMAYGPPELNVNVYSSPLLDCGGHSCGVGEGAAGAADNAQMLRVMAPVVAAYAPGSLGVQRPNTDEQFPAGAAFNVTWTTLGVTGKTFDIDLYDGDRRIQSLAANVRVETNYNVICTGSNCGSWVNVTASGDSARDYCTGPDCRSVRSKSFPVTLPSDLAEGERYRIHVASREDAAVNNRSAAFSVKQSRLIVVPDREMVVSEAGWSDEFTLVLNTPVSANVRLRLISSDPSEGIVTPSRVTFTPNNWDRPRTITVTGVDDNRVDGDIRFAVITAPLVSDDPFFNGIDPADIAVINFDVEPDADGDGFADAVDQFPNDPLEHRDTDGDGIGDRADDDDDGDRIPDVFEISHGLNPLNRNDRKNDPDGDNLTNLEEYRLGTDPNRADEDTDNDGVPDIADSAPTESSDNGKRRLLTEGKMFTGLYGNGFGNNRYYSVILFTFEGSDRDIVLNVTGFDIDSPDEVSVSLNERNLGYLSVTENKAMGTRPDYFYIPASDQVPGTNHVAMVQKTPGFMWGVTKVALHALQDQPYWLSMNEKDRAGFGYRFSGSSVAPVERFAFKLKPDELGIPYQFSFTAFDVDIDGAAQVYLNNELVGIVRSSETKLALANRVALPVELLLEENIIDIVNLHPNELWGVSNLKVSPLNDIVRGNPKFGQHPPHLAILPAL